MKGCSFQTDSSQLGSKNNPLAIHWHLATRCLVAWLGAGDWLRLVAGGSGARAWLALGLGLGWLVTGVWSLAIQLVDWLVVQEGMVQCQGTGATGEWLLVWRLVMVVGCW